MASRLTSSYRSKKRSSTDQSQPVSAIGPWMSINYARDDTDLRPASPQSSNPARALSHVDTLESFDRQNQLNEPLLDTRDSALLVQPPDEAAQEHEESTTKSGSFRKRTRAWRRGMRLPRTRRQRRATVYDAFIDSSKNTPQYVKNCTSDNLLG